MPNYTTNLRLEKPLGDEQYNIDVFNANADKIDQFAGQIPARALTADKLTTGAKINEVNFKGDSDITLPTVNTSGNQTVRGIKTFSEVIQGTIANAQNATNDGNGDKIDETYIKTADLADKWHALKSYADIGEVLTDAEGLADVKSYAHSTFDSSKFTSFIQGSLTITDNGIASGFSRNPNNNIKITVTPTTNDYIIEGEFTMPNPLPTANDVPFSAGATVNGETVLLFSLRYNSNNNSLLLLARNTDGSNITLSNPNITAIAGGSYKYKIVTNNADVSFYINNTLVDTMSNFCEVLPDFLILGADRNNLFPFTGTEDLKQFAIIEAGATVFNGNKTGIDTYTISGNTVTIPYTLSKTGSKIVDSAYRTQVTSVYNEFGYSPYYTLDEANGNFTLPQGEIYGMMLNQSTPHVVETYNGNNVAEGYILYSDGYCVQWGTATITSGYGNVNLFKSYKDKYYNVVANQTWGDATAQTYVNADIVTTYYMTAASFGILASDNADGPLTGTAFWQSYGFVE